jgi:hypothetical protein
LSWFIARVGIESLEFGFKHGKRDQKTSRKEGEDGHVNSCNTESESSEGQGQEKTNDTANKGKEHHAAAGLHNLCHKGRHGAFVVFVVGNQVGSWSTTEVVTDNDVVFVVSREWSCCAGCDGRVVLVVGFRSNLRERSG